MKRVLFLCSRDRLRSPTAEAIFSVPLDIEVESAGLSPKADVACTTELVEWADVIFVMERIHRTRLNSRSGRHLQGARVICLDIPDDYAFMAPALVDLLRKRVARHLPRGTSVA